MQSRPATREFFKIGYLFKMLKRDTRTVNGPAQNFWSDVYPNRHARSFL
ncbi:hypothetical protein HMPREF0293_0548 [Corynebacterium glucuronolyticum ATCC 51866]|uniref:Uncharacterized protein n=1 Tax=Corynebacterium glucuronolyticum ATCC 51866 TaxID=548478 RepID=A0ABP2DVH5_9CORY|nr:hypothetical protein HMPREF0293_0548 [Corynebacterium glucuronolyticum ATCC 51866]